MTFRSYIFDRAVIIPIVLVVLAGGYFLYRTAPKNPAPAAPLPNAEATAFMWKFVSSDASSTPDGTPQTNVYLEVSYADGSVKKNLIDSVPMSCNELDTNEPDSLSGTKDVQCYAAGAGWRYKITKGDESYLIQRKAFEEALPNQEPPAHDYHVITEIYF